MWFYTYSNLVFNCIVMGYYMYIICTVMWFYTYSNGLAQRLSRLVRREESDIIHWTHKNHQITSESSTLLFKIT